MLQTTIRTFYILQILYTITVQAQGYECDSLICEPPKTCIVQDQIAQCLLMQPQVITTLGFGAPNLMPSPSTANPLEVFLPKNSNKPETTTASPLAPLLNLFGPPLTLPTLPPPSTTTAKPTVDICTLPPLTGFCSHARIMWYYDTETGKCERFSYSGCGNQNKFSSKSQCEQTCNK